MTNSFTKFRLLTLLIIIFNLFPIFSNAQKKTKDSTDNIIQRPGWITNIDCNRTPASTCNLIENYKFNTTCFGFDPFRTLCVNKWDYCFGSPQINAFPPLLAPTYNHASMWSRSNLGMQDSATGEGIVTAIPKLTVGNKYSFSLFKRAFKEPLAANTLKLDEFNIVLMKCADYEQMKLGNINFVPNIPTSAQVIYCEKNINNGNFQKISISFTAISDYDVLWIFPKQWTWAADQWWLEVAKPELIDVTNFSAGLSPNPVPPNCNVTIGPNTPNCGLEDAIFTWYGPNGQIIPAPTNQQIQVDAGNAANVGTWSLKMVVPNVVTTNNTCSQNANIQATVSVPVCQSCAIISANSPLDKCWVYDGGNFITLSSTLTSNIQWYNNGNPILGATSQTYTENNNPGPAWPTSTGTYYVKNTQTNCISNILTVIRRNWASPNPDRTRINYCKSQLGTISQAASLTDPSTIYSWQILDQFGNDVTGTSVLLGANNSNVNNTTISFSNYPYLTATIIAKAIDNTCNNSAAAYQVNINPGPCRFSFDREESKNINVRIYPNPAANQITLTTNDAINSIEISDLMTPTLKRIKSNGAKSIILNVFDLKPGIYKCKITTSKGVENQKLIIKRQ